MDLDDDDDLSRSQRRPPYPGDDSRPTSRKELAGWYSYGWAAEVFAVCGVGMLAQKCSWGYYMNGSHFPPFSKYISAIYNMEIPTCFNLTIRAFSTRVISTDHPRADGSRPWGASL